ncbi:hypothetical protein TNCV_2382111 [Trichonephila clavipes]|nr:hypothetical protein TNCV_2382111 [Trichonephila clavipes]
MRWFPMSSHRLRSDVPLYSEGKNQMYTKEPTQMYANIITSQMRAQSTENDLIPFGCSHSLKAQHHSKWRRLTATAGSEVVQSGRPIFDDFFQHLWPYIGNNTANVVFQMVKRLWLIRIDQ